MKKIVIMFFTLVLSFFVFACDSDNTKNISQVKSDPAPVGHLPIYFKDDRCGVCYSLIVWGTHGIGLANVPCDQVMHLIHSPGQLKP